MKNFTAALLSCHEGVVSYSSRSQVGKNLGVKLVYNYRAILFKNISLRNFLSGFYSIFSKLFKSVRWQFMVILKEFYDFDKCRDCLALVIGSMDYPNMGKVSVTTRYLVCILIALFTLNSTIANAQCTGTSLTGLVFRDFNLNGVKDNANEIGLAGVTVNAFDSNNVQVGTTTVTATNGTYSITGLSGSVRVEFSTLPTGYVSGPDGSSSGTSVQFVTLSSTIGCGVNFGVNHPDDFCAKSGVQPKIAVPCYANGAFSSTGTNGAGLEDALVSFPYNKTGDKATSGNAPNLLASYNKIGSVWGMAYNKYNKTLFATAFMKRHSGFGPKGISGLYVVQNADANGLGTVTGINLQTLLGIDAGTEPTRNFAVDKTQSSDDGGNTVFNAVGKMSFGDCELSTDGNILYITNLFDKKIYVLNVTNPLSPTLITSYLVPNPACAVGSEYAPFGLKFYRDKLYVGVVCTAESSQPATAGATYGQVAFDRTTLSSSNLKATVYELNGTTFSTALAQFPLNYDRGRSNSDSASYAIWRPWVSNFSQVNNNSGETYPQPMLSDIELDSDGSMILGFADRYSHQLGNANYPPGGTNTVTGRVEGDVMRATKSGSTWTIENNGTASGITTSGANKKGGPGGGEYYFGDLTIDHDEPAMGGLALYPGTGEIMTTIAGTLDIPYSGGTRRMNNNTGDYLYTGAPTAPNLATWNSVPGYRFAVSSRPDQTGDYKLYSGDTPGTFGKASGLGDIEVFCSTAPLEIGNRIWRDYNRNGIQDAGELGIGTITVLLFKGGVQIASTATDANGEYYFNDANVTGGLLPNMAYEIRVLQSQVGNNYLSPANATTDNIDSDASFVGGNAIIALTTGVYGESNHTYDIGFSPNCPTFANPQPNGGNVTVCSGTATSLNLTGSNVGSQPLPVSTSVQWVYFNSVTSNPYFGGTLLSPTATLADGTVTSNLSFPTNTGLTPIIYYVYAILNPMPDGSDPNCRPSVAYVVTVSPIPSAPTNILGGGTFCTTAANSSFPLIATCAINTTPVWYASQSTTTNFFIGDTYNATTTGTFTYYVACKGTSSPNCETIATDRKPVTIIINDTPFAPIVSAQGGSNTACGTSATLNGACAAGTGLIPTWSNGVVANSINVTVSGTYTAKCISATCSSSNSANLDVTISANPSTPIISGENLSVCKDAVTSLTATGCLGNYNWSNGGVGSTISVPTGVVGTINYTVMCTVGICTSSPSAVVSVSVNANPASPTSSNVTPGSRCDTGSVTLTATCLTGQVPQWYNGNANNSTFLIAGTSYFPNINATTTYFVGCKTTATNCETPAGSRTSVVGTVNPNLPAPSSVTSNDSCQVVSDIPNTPTLIKLLATCSTGQTPQWFNAGGILVETDNPFTASVLVTTLFTVGCKDNITGCETISANRRSVVATVIVNLSNGGQIAANQSSCGPFVPAKLTNVQSASGGNSTVEYLWLKNSTASQFADFNPNDPAWVSTLIETPEYQPSTISITTTFIRCARSAGCKDYAVESNPVIITINSVPSKPTNVNSTAGVVCLNETYTLSASCAVGQTLLWYNDLTPTMTFANGTVITASVTGTYNYTVYCKDNNTVCATLEADRVKVKVMVVNRPTAPINAIAGDGDICDDETVNLSATCSSISQTPQWYNSAGASITNLTLSGLISGVVYTYYVGCRETASGCETEVGNRKPVTLKVNKVPTFPGVYAISKGAICLGESVNLTATCETGEIAKWYEGNALVGTGTSVSLTPTGLIARTYSVGCKSSSTTCETKGVNRKIVTLTINSVPDAPSSATGGAVCGSGTVDLKATCATGTIPVWYEAAIGNAGGVTGTLYKVTVTINKPYYVSCRSTTSPTCCESTEASRKKVDVIFNMIPNPIITKVDPVCLGTTYKLNVSGAAGNTFAWTSSNRFTSTEQNPTVIPTPTAPGTYTYFATISGIGGCTGTATTSVIVNALPTATATGANVCAETEIKVDVNPTFESYAWTGASGFTASTKNPLVTANATAISGGKYQVTVTDANGCAAIAITTVMVKAVPTVSVTPTSICAGTAGTLTSSTVADVYSWSGPNGFTGTTQSVTVKDKGTYTLNITSGGCTAVATTTVNEKSTANIKATSAEVCTGGTTTLLAENATTYAWAGPGTYTATGATPTVSVAGLYTVVGTTEGGCIGTATATLTVNNNPKVIISGETIICASDKTTLTASGTGIFAWTGTGSFSATTASVEVTVGTYQVTVTNAGCSAVGTIKVVNDNLSISAGGGTVCEGVLITALTGGATATSGIKSYEWSSPSGFSSSEQSPTITKPTATVSYTLTVTSKAGCTATATAIITVTPAVINTANVTFCKGGKATLTATGGTSAAYLWTGGATTSSIEVTIAGTYNVTITDVTGCISKGIFTVTESTAAGVIITGNNLLCTSTSTKLTVNEGIIGETYSWTGTGGFASNSQMINVSVPGDYAVLVKTKEGCEGTAKVSVNPGFTPIAVCGPVCVGDSIRFSATQLRGLTYSWSKNGTFISSSADPKLLNVQKSDEGVYQVMITGGGCTVTVVATLVVYDKPTGITATGQSSTCNQDTLKNNGSVKLSGTFTGLRYDIVEGETYTGTRKYSDATNIPANGIVKYSIANPATNAGTKYTVRVFNANNCYQDYSVIIQQVICSCSEAKCVPFSVVKAK